MAACGEEKVDDCLYARPELRQGRWELDFDGVIKNTALAFFRADTVLEIDWGFDAEGSRWVPRRYRKILPNYYAWTTQSDQPDALMLYPNGTGQQPCIPFPENKFIVALGEALGDHPIFANKLVALIPWYIAAEFGLKEALNFIAHYAQPIKHVKYGAAKQYEAAVNMMKKFGNNTWLVSPKSLELEIINASQNGNGSSPHLALLQAAQNQVDMVIGGQKLASGTADTGANSRALGEVHNEVRKEVVESMADFVKRVLNTQLIPAILRLNMGELPEHLPSIEFTDPNSHADESKLNFVMRVLETIPVAKQWPYEQLNIPMPEDGAELFEAVGSTPYGGSGTSPFDEEDDKDEEEDEDGTPDGTGDDDDEINAADSRRREEPIQVRGKDGEIEECYTKNCKRHRGKKYEPAEPGEDDNHRRKGEKGGKKGDKDSTPVQKPYMGEDAQERSRIIDKIRSFLRSGFQKSGQGEVNFDNRVPTAMIQEYCDTLEEMMGKYPVDTLEELGSRNDKEMPWSYAASRGGRQLLLNHDNGKIGIFALKDGKPYDEATAKERGFKRFGVGATPDGNSLKAIIIHEWGHVVSAACEKAKALKEKSKRYRIPFDKNLEPAAKAWETWEKLCKRSDVKRYFRNKLGEYSRTNTFEAFAESFAYREYEGGKLPDILNSAIDNIINFGTVKRK